MGGLLKWLLSLAWWKVSLEAAGNPPGGPEEIKFAALLGKSSLSSSMSMSAAPPSLMTGGGGGGGRCRGAGGAWGTWVCITGW